MSDKYSIRIVKNKCKYGFSVITILILTINSLLGQPDPSEYIPPSPNISSLAKFAEVPVSYYTGIPSVGIPLFQTKLKEAELDISISYHSMGNKVNDIASSIGLGWALSAGGVIKREVRGIPDEWRSAWDENPDNISANEFYEYCEDIIGGSTDAEPDIFYYNIGGYTGKFFIDYDDNIKLFEKSDIDIKIAESGQGGIFVFEITTPNGYVYSFGENDYREKLVSSTSLANGVFDGYFLSSIKDNSNNTLATFEYEPEYIGFSRRGVDYANYAYPATSADPYKSGGSPINLEPVWSQSSNTFRLKKIVFIDGSITFNYKDEKREDVHSNFATTIVDYCKALDNIVINSLNEEVKKVSFLTSYFITPADGNEGNYYWGDADYKRLRLDGLLISSPNDLENEYYSFLYNSEPLPPVNSRCVDHWGFYNGKINGVYKNESLGHMIPSLTNEYLYAEIWTATTEEPYFIQKKDPVTKTFTTTGADREPVEEYTKACVLEQINLPTGGYQKFEYEINNYYDENSTSNKNGGGLRIKKQTIFDGKKEEQLEYNYTQKNNTSRSSGFLVTKPGYISFSYNSSAGVIWKPEMMISSSTTSESRTSGGGIVVYENIEVKKFKEVEGVVSYNGKTVYNYNVTNDSELEDFQKTMRYTLPVPPDVTIHVFEEVTDPLGYYRPNAIKLLTNEGIQGKLKSVSYYQNDSDIPTRVESYNYAEGVINQFSAMKCVNHNGLFLIRKYYLQNSFVYLASKSVAQDGVTNTTDYNYHNLLSSEDPIHFQVISEIHNEDDPLEKEIIYKYPLDYSLDVDITEEPSSYHDESILLTMWNRNIVNKPIETIEKVNNKIVDGSIVKYDVFPYVENYSDITDEHFIKPSELYKLETNTPIEAVDFSESKIIYQSALTKDGHYKVKTSFDSYDEDANLLQYSKENDITSSYIWGYNNTLPIAKVDNATADEIFYDSFEEEASWSSASYDWFTWHTEKSYSDTRVHSGSKSLKTVNSNGTNEIYFFTPELKINNSVTTRYKATCWVYSEGVDGPTADLVLLYRTTTDEGSAHSYCIDPGCFNEIRTKVKESWTLLEVELDVPTTARRLEARIDNNSEGTVYFDDLRIYPVDAQMTSYTYKPLIGITSQTDARDYTTYYEYDDFGRLERIKDNDGNIVEEYKYNYGTPISPTSLSFPQSGGTKNLTVNTEKSWQITDLPSFISSVSPSSGMGKATVAVTCSVNSGTAARSGEMTFTYDGKTKTINISQETSLVTPSVTITSPTEGSYASLGNDDYLTINWNTNYEGNITIEIINNSIWYSFIQTFSSSVGNNSYDWYFVDDQGTTFEPGECVIMIYGDDSNVNDQVTFTLVE